jgi:hypothetical protein
MMRNESGGKRCRAVAEEEYTLETQAASYKRIYDELLHKNGKHA